MSRYDGKKFQLRRMSLKSEDNPAKPPLTEPGKYCRHRLCLWGSIFAIITVEKRYDLTKKVFPIP